MVAGVHLYLSVAFAGLVSFLSPCVLPLVPPLAIYLWNTWIAHMSRRSCLAIVAWPNVIWNCWFVALGFMAVFVARGASTSRVGHFLTMHNSALAFAASVVIILFGLDFMGFFGTLTSDRYNNRRPTVFATSDVGAAVMGAALGLSWTPCVGPTLSTILGVAGRQETMVSGIALLAAYSVGLGIALLLVADIMRPLHRLLPLLGDPLELRKDMGQLLVAAGLLVATSAMTVPSTWLLETFPGLASLEESLTPATLRTEIIQYVRLP